MITVVLGAIIDRVVLLGLPEAPPHTKKSHTTLSILLEALMAGLRVAVTEVVTQARDALMTETLTGVWIISIILGIVFIGLVSMITELATTQLIGPLERVRLHEIEQGLDRSKKREARAKRKKDEYIQYKLLRVQQWVGTGVLAILLIWLVISSLGFGPEFLSDIFGYLFIMLFIIFIIIFVINKIRILIDRRRKYLPPHP